MDASRDPKPTREKDPRDPTPYFSPKKGAVGRRQSALRVRKVDSFQKMTKITAMKHMKQNITAFISIGLIMFGSPSQAHAKHQDVCISYRGNGPKFPSLLGQTAALLEFGYHPRVSVGGSSGANVAALVQALVENPTIAEGSTPTQTAAQVLKASRPLLDAFIFLPRFDRPSTFIHALITYLKGQWRDDRVAGPAEFSLAHSEHALAQVLLFADFFGRQNFEPISRLGSDSERVAFVENLFVSSAQAFRTSPAFVMRTLLPTDESEINHTDAQRFRSILSGYLTLGQSTSKQRTSAGGHKLHPWSALRWMKKLSPAQQQWARNAVWNLLRKSSFFPGTEMSESQTLIFPSAEILESILLSKPGELQRDIPVPRGLIAHTTAFSGTHPTAQNLKQFYFSGERVHSELRSQWISNGGKLPLMTFESSSGSFSVMPPEKIWVAKDNHALAEILQATIAEPLLFERHPIALSDEEKIELTGSDQIKWNANGGWLDTASYPLLRRLPQCDGLPIVLVTPRDGINSFQKQALRGLLDLPKAHNGQPDPLHSTEIFLNLQMYLKEVVRNEADRIVLDFDWDAALQRRPEGTPSLRQYLFDAGYQHATNILRKLQ